MTAGTGGSATAVEVVGVEAEGRVVEVDHADAADGRDGAVGGSEMV